MVADDPGVVFQVIEEIDHEPAVCAQADLGSLINIARIDLDRVPILSAPATDLRCAAREAAEVWISRVICRRQNISVQIGGVEDRDLNDVTAQCARGACDVWRRVKQSGAADGFDKCAASGGPHVFIR